MKALRIVGIGAVHLLALSLCCLWSLVFLVAIYGGFR